ISLISPPLVSWSQIRKLVIHRIGAKAAKFVIHFYRGRLPEPMVPAVMLHDHKLEIIIKNGSLLLAELLQRGLLSKQNTFVNVHYVPTMGRGNAGCRNQSGGGSGSYGGQQHHHQVAAPSRPMSAQTSAPQITMGSSLYQYLSSQAPGLIPTVHLLDSAHTSSLNSSSSANHLTTSATARPSYQAFLQQHSCYVNQQQQPPSFQHQSSMQQQQQPSTTASASA